jgi:hypothetical protein
MGMAADTSPLPRFVGICRFGIGAEEEEPPPASAAAARLSVDVDMPLSPPPRACKSELDRRSEAPLVAFHFSLLRASVCRQQRERERERERDRQTEKERE